MDPTLAPDELPLVRVTGPCCATMEPDEDALDAPLFTVMSPDSPLDAVNSDASPLLLAASVVAPLLI